MCMQIYADTSMIFILYSQHSQPTQHLSITKPKEQLAKGTTFKQVYLFGIRIFMPGLIREEIPLYFMISSALTPG